MSWWIELLRIDILKRDSQVALRDSVQHHLELGIVYF